VSRQITKQETTNEADASRKEPEMAYKKPQIVAKSDAQQSFVAGCPEKNVQIMSCNLMNNECFCGQLN
jgi:hypothetical protein